MGSHIGLQLIHKLVIYRQSGQSIIIQFPVQLTLIFLRILQRAQSVKNLVRNSAQCIFLLLPASVCVAIRENNAGL